MKVKNLKCHKCNSVELKGVSQGDHMGVYCSKCDSWIKWASKSQRAQLEAQSGVYSCDSLQPIIDGLDRIEAKIDEILRRE